MPSAAEHNPEQAPLRAPLAAEIAELTDGLTFPARQHVHVKGKLVDLRIHPRRQPRKPQGPEPPQYLDVVLLLKPHDLPSETDEEEIEGRREGYRDLAAADEPNIRAIGLAGLAKLDEQLARQRLSRADLTSLELVLMRQGDPQQGRPYPVIMLPAVHPDDNGRAVFHNVPVGASVWLAPVRRAAAIPEEPAGAKIAYTSDEARAAPPQNGLSAEEAGARRHAVEQPGEEDRAAGGKATLAELAARMLRENRVLLPHIGYDPPDRRMEAELLRNEDGSARLVVTSESSLAGAIVAYRFGPEEGQLTIVRSEDDTWGAEGQIRADYSRVAAHLPEFRITPSEGASAAPGP